MHIAILMTNTDETDFAQRHPKDGEKFTDLIHLVRPGWMLSVFSVKDEEFPETIDAFDGFIVTGSPASVHDDAEWIERLLDLIREVVAADKPLFGACFGHQAIAVALGGAVENNPGGWEFGTCQRDVVAHKPWTKGLGERLYLYGSHKEQVTKLPKSAEVLVSSPEVPVAGFSIGEQVYTTQNHPEMSHEFIEALIDELADTLDEEVIDKARTSLAQAAETERYAETIARFFEHAAHQKAGS